MVRRSSELLRLSSLGVVQIDTPRDMRRPPALRWCRTRAPALPLKLRNVRVQDSLHSREGVTFRLSVLPRALKQIGA